MSPILLCALVAYFAFGSISVIAMIGKPRKPIAPDVAIVNLVIAMMIVASLFIWGR